MTHQELAQLLGVRVHNSLLDLVRDKEIRRDHLGPAFVYFSRKVPVRKTQTERRRSLLEQRPKPRPTGRQTISVLLELIKAPKATREEIGHRCQRGGISISYQIVEEIFAMYELDKKRAL
jgi:hypothetical protein